MVDPLWSAVAGASVVALVWLLASLRKREQSPYGNAFELKLPDFASATTRDAAAAQILREVAGWVPGEGYYAYWLTGAGTTMRLCASFATPAAIAPLGVPADPTLVKPRMAGAKTEHWLELPFGRHLLIRIQIKHGERLPGAQLTRLERACEHYAPLTLAVERYFSAQEESAASRALMHSMQVALDATLRMDKGLEMLLNVARQLTEATLAIAVVEGPQQPLTLPETPEGRALGAEILAGKYPTLLTLPTEPDILPGGGLGALGDRYNACIRVPIVLQGRDPAGCFFLFTQHPPSLTPYQHAALRTLAERAEYLLSNQRQIQSGAGDYIETLRVLVQAMDGLTPYSMGHSDRLSRYARLIAQEMGLSNYEREAVALAAYFHDVGMVAVDNRMVLKPQQLTSDEYSLVKQHAELGAQLVSSLPGTLSPMVAGHHERWDGRGYPRGLKGDEIPLGARIIAAADLLEAKSTGRSYRQPLPFARVVQDLREAAGNHLDPQVVEAMLRVLGRQPLAVNNATPGGRCWEIKQMPEHVCAGCPNRTAQPVRCWENRANLCTRHGDTCETCVVYTSSLGLTTVPGRG